MYLRSLKAIGIELRLHDIRFEEDNWESPTLGAWGMGWQVLLDGLEITQFTYFQQSGGIDLDPISVESPTVLNASARSCKTLKASTTSIGPLTRPMATSGLRKSSNSLYTVSIAATRRLARRIGVARKGSQRTAGGLEAWEKGRTAHAIRCSPRTIIA